MISLFKQSAKPTDAQRAAVEDLRKFALELKQHQANLRVYPQSAVRLIVEFFNTTSPRQDSDLPGRLSMLKGNDAFRESLRRLNILLQGCGRDRYGHNRTTFGQHVRDENVFLGAVYGVNTFNVAEIMAKGDDTEYYQIVNAQATRFMVSYLEPMIGLVDDLLKAQVVTEIK